MRYITYIIILILILAFLFLNNHDFGNEPVNYISRSFYHADLTHLLANLFSFYNLSYMEEVIGRAQFIFAIIFIAVISSLLLYIYHKMVPSRKVYTVGFSGVIFGLIVVFYSMLGMSSGESMTRLILSIIPQFFVVGISYEGHICGIIAGLLYITFFPVKKALAIN